MKQIINTDNWERRDNFNFFRGFVNPYISLTSEVKCTAARTGAKTAGDSFFLCYLYAILRAANEVKEMRYRINGQGQVVLYDSLDVLTPVTAGANGRFFTVRIPYDRDFRKFHDTARRIIKDIPADGDPYGAENTLSEDELLASILVSATPDLYFTAITHTLNDSSGHNYPLLNVGKAVPREGELVIPIAITVHHGLVDGAHLSAFFSKTEQYLEGLYK